MSAPVSPTVFEEQSLVTPAPSETKIWGTKGIGFWALLSAILVKARPESLLELGSGRSTTFLADYAFRHRKLLVSIEQDEVWHRKALSDLQFMNVRGHHVHHVPVVKQVGAPPWYHREQMIRLLGGRSFDLVFIDGPQGGARRNPEGQALIAEAARDARLIIVDDVQRDYNLIYFDTLAARTPPDGRFFYRYGHNLIALASDDWRALLAETFDFLALEFTRTAPALEASHDED